MQPVHIFRSISLAFIIVVIIYSCSKGGSTNPPAPDPCAGVTITVTGTTVNPTAAGSSDGSISATGSGASGLLYSINGGAFQASGNFTGLAAGSYTVTARSGNNCTGSASFTLTAPNQCTGVTITVSNAVVNNSPCQPSPTGSITVTATGGTGPYTYRLNSGAFQSSNIFSALAAGTYSVTARDANGCSTSAGVTVSNLPAGPLFTAVRTLLQNNCVSCHNATISEGGMNWTVDCNIVTFKNNIKLRAVDGVPTPMPQGGLLPAAERQKITDWINAGGRYSD